MMYVFQIMKQTIDRELEKYTNKPEFLSKISQERYFIFCGVFGTFLIMFKCITDAYRYKKNSDPQLKKEKWCYILKFSSVFLQKY